jgi:hypothetical protein
MWGAGADGEARVRGCGEEAVLEKSANNPVHTLAHINTYSKIYKYRNVKTINDLERMK